MNIEKILSTAFLVPLDDPSDKGCRWGLNTFLWGEPGIGKSDRVEAAGMMVGLPVRTTYAATSQPEDVSGAAFTNNPKAVAMFEAFLTSIEDGFSADSLPGFLRNSLAQKAVQNVVKAARRYGPSFTRIEPLLPGVSDLMIDEQGVWFIDELSCARPAVQAGYLGAVLARKVGGLKLPPGIRIVAAANPPESAAGGWELEPPMANRFCHFDVPTPTREGWNEWLLNEQMKSIELIDDGEQKVRDAWPEKWAITKGLFSGLMHAGAAPLHSIPAEGAKERGRAWPSPRTWAFAARAYSTCLSLDTDAETRDAFMRGCVGEGAATSAIGWISKADLPSPKDVLDKGWQIDRKRLDRAVAVYTTMVDYVVKHPDTAERKKLAVKAWNRLEETISAQILDISMSRAVTMVRSGLGSAAGPDVEKAAAPFLKEIAKNKRYSQYLPKDNT